MLRRARGSLADRVVKCVPSGVVEILAQVGLDVVA
jgi:hypothetical protein